MYEVQGTLTCPPTPPHSTPQSRYSKTCVLRERFSVRRQKQATRTIHGTKHCPCALSESQVWNTAMFLHQQKSSASLGITSWGVPKNWHFPSSCCWIHWIEFRKPNISRYIPLHHQNPMIPLHQNYIPFISHYITTNPMNIPLNQYKSH